MTDVWPKHLTPDDAPWARRVESGVKSAETALQTLGTQVTAQNQGTAASLDALREQIVRLQETNAELSATVSYLQSLSVVSTVSGTSLTGVPSGDWTTNAGLRPSITASTPTGRLRIVVSGLIAYSIATYSIPGYVTRSSAYLTTDSSRMMVESVGSLMVWSREVIQDGLPIDTSLTIQGEVWGFSGTPFGGISASAGFIGISAQPIP